MNRRSASIAALGALLALLSTAGLAQAGSVSASDGFGQTFAVTMPKVRADGSYTFTLQWDTTVSGGAGVAPPVTDVEMKLPAGVEIRKRFLRGKFVCDVAKLRQTHDPATCKTAQIGAGRIEMDFQPFTTQLVPANIYVFLGRGGAGALASMVVLAVPDTSNSFVRDNAIVANTKPVMVASIYKELGNGFGLRVELPIDIDAPVLVSIQDFKITMTGLSSGSGKRKQFWVSQPSCKSRSAKFQATFQYVNAGARTVGTAVKRRFKCA